MVLFSKSVITKSYLLAQRTFSTTKANSFAHLIRSLPKPVPKLPHPEHLKSVSLWKYLVFLVAIPAVILVQGNIILFEDHHPKRPEFHTYEYMRRRNKKFPWGDGNHSLFHNPYYNALPDGYELPEHEEHGDGHH